MAVEVLLLPPHTNVTHSRQLSGEGGRSSACGLKGLETATSRLQFAEAAAFLLD